MEPRRELTDYGYESIAEIYAHLPKKLKGERDYYIIEKHIHTSKMNIIYLARSTGGRKVVIKIPNVQNPERDYWKLERLREETVFLANTDHPNIVRYVDRGIEIPFLAEEYVEGKLLSSFAGVKGKEALRIIYQVMQAIKYIHSKGYVYGDLKPSNVIVRGGHPVLIDLGSIMHASRREHEYILATRDWQAPEQAAKIMVPQTDIYQIGLLLFYLLTGRKFKEFIWQDAFRLLREKRVSDRTISFLERALSELINDRPQTIQEAERMLYLVAHLNIQGKTYKVL